MATDKKKPDLNSDQGFVKKPFAIRKLVQDANGNLQVVYVDARTGNPVNNPKGYTVIEADNTVDTTRAKTTGNVATPEDKPATTTEMVQGTFHGRSDSPALSAVTDDKKSMFGDQYGYTNKPGWMGFTSMLPGPLGTLGKFANIAINAENTQAVNDQREALGFSENSTAKNIASAVSDQKGYIGEATVTSATGTKTTAPVGFEASDKYDRTTYTPEEARRRQVINDNLEEATEAEKQQAIRDFQEQNPSNSVFGSIANAAKDFFGNIFGTASAPPGTPDANGFPAAPTAPSPGSFPASNPGKDGQSVPGGMPSGGVSGHVTDKGGIGGTGYSSPGLF